MSRNRTKKGPARRKPRARRADRNTCHYCSRRATTSDHIVPRSLGGRDAAWNRVPACEPCNQRKASEMPTCSCDRCSEAVWRFGDGQRRGEPVDRWEHLRISLAKYQSAGSVSGPL